MYIDIEPGIIGDEPIIGTFKETGKGTQVSQVRLHLSDGWHWCEVIGWSEQGVQAAIMTPIEESGDGPALLLHGGAHGLRLRRCAGKAGDASANAAGQEWWSEGFLILRPEAERR
jgi:hypothetical protein